MGAYGVCHLFQTQLALIKVTLSFIKRLIERSGVTVC